MILRQNLTAFISHMNSKSQLKEKKDVKTIKYNIAKYSI